MNIVIDWTVSPSPQTPSTGPSPVIAWAATGSGGAVIITTTGNQIQTLGIIGEQDDRGMFNTPMGPV